MQYKTTWDLQSIPDESFYPEAGRRNAARRKTASGFRENAGKQARNWFAVRAVAVKWSAKRKRAGDMVAAEVHGRARW